MKIRLFMTLMVIASWAIPLAGAQAQGTDKLSVAIVINCQPNWSLLHGDKCNPPGPDPSGLVTCINDSLGRVFLSSGKYLLIERDKQSVLNEEIRTRIGKGEDPEVVMKDVGSKYRVDYILYVTSVSMECQYDPGIIIVSPPVCDGTGRASGSWVRVSTGATEVKPEAEVDLKMKDVDPPKWFDQMSHDLARRLLEKIVPAGGFMVTQVRDERCVLINHGREDGVRETNQYIAREPADADGLPGKAICYVRVTDRLGDHAAECQVFEIKGGPPMTQIMGRIKSFIDANRFPEVVEPPAKRQRIWDRLHF